MCPNHRNLCSLKYSSIFSTPIISQIISLLMPCLSVLPHIMRSILISVVCNFLSSSFLKANSRHHSIRHFLHNFYTCFLALVTPLFYTVLLLYLLTSAIHIIAVLLLALLLQSWEHAQDTRILSLFLTSSSSVIFSSTSVLSLKSEHFLHTKFTTLVKHFLILFASICYIWCSCYISCMHATSTTSLHNRYLHTFCNADAVYWSGNYVVFIA